MDTKPHGWAAPLCGIALLIGGIFLGRDAGTVFPLLGQALLALCAGALVGWQQPRAEGVDARRSMQDSALIALAGFVLTHVVSTGLWGGDFGRVAVDVAASIAALGCAARWLLGSADDRPAKIRLLAHVLVAVCAVWFARGDDALAGVTTLAFVGWLVVERERPEGEGLVESLTARLERAKDKRRTATEARRAQRASASELTIVPGFASAPMVPVVPTDESPHGDASAPTVPHLAPAGKRPPTATEKQPKKHRVPVVPVLVACVAAVLIPWSTGVLGINSVVFHGTMTLPLSGSILAVAYGLGFWSKMHGYKESHPGATRVLRAAALLYCLAAAGTVAWLMWGKPHEESVGNSLLFGYALLQPFSTATEVAAVLMDDHRGRRDKRWLWRRLAPVGAVAIGGLVATVVVAHWLDSHIPGTSTPGAGDGVVQALAFPIELLVGQTLMSIKAMVLMALHTQGDPDRKKKPRLIAHTLTHVWRWKVTDVGVMRLAAIALAAAGAVASAAYIWGVYDLGIHNPLVTQAYWIVVTLSAGATMYSQQIDTATDGVDPIDLPLRGFMGLLAVLAATVAAEFVWRPSSGVFPFMLAFVFANATPATGGWVNKALEYRRKRGDSTHDDSADEESRHKRALRQRAASAVIVVSVVMAVVSALSLLGGFAHQTTIVYIAIVAAQMTMFISKPIGHLSARIVNEERRRWRLGTVVVLGIGGMLAVALLAWGLAHPGALAHDGDSDVTELGIGAISAAYIPAAALYALLHCSQRGDEAHVRRLFGKVTDLGVFKAIFWVLLVGSVGLGVYYVIGVWLVGPQADALQRPYLWDDAFQVVAAWVITLIRRWLDELGANPSSEPEPEAVSAKPSA